MKSLRGLMERSLSALLMAISVALLTAGLFSYVTPPAVGDALPTPGQTVEAANPIFTSGAVAAATPPPAASAPASTAPATTPAATPSVGVGSPGATASPASPSASIAAEPSARPGATPLPGGGGGGVATRVVIPSLGVDLPIVSGEAQVRGNRDSYPLCDVAQYLVYYVNPGQVGTSYIYAHAQRGMFLPLLRASQRNDGAEMIGALVEVYTADNRLHLYEIYRVKRHARDLSLANNVPPGEHILVLQTSEGTRGHIPKLQVAARPIGVLPATPEEARPPARPRPCWR